MSQLKPLQLANKPTPLEFLEKTSNKLNISLWIKRDDLTGDIVSGGNKIRKLEYLLNDAKLKGADTILAVGGAQSNLAKTVAALSLRLGLKPVLVFMGDQPTKLQSNYFFNTIMGVEMYFTGHSHPNTLEAEMRKLAEDLKLKGKNPYMIPFGGTNGLGAMGYMDAYRELETQKKEKDIHFDWEFVTVGSGGTLAGVILGHQLYHSRSKLVGISVLFPEREAKERVLQCIEDTIHQLGEDTFISEEPEVQIDDQFIGDGYGIPTEKGIYAIRRLGQDEGLILDHVYTGKAMAGLLHYVEQGIIAPGDSVLFWHTGGAPGLLSIEDQWGKFIK